MSTSIKTISKLLLLILMLQLTACNSKQEKYHEGTFEGTGEGHIGSIKVSIVTDKYKIKQIKIIEEEETPVIAEIVYRKIPKSVIKENSAEVDVVTGATYTSKGLLNAIKQAVQKATLPDPKAK